MSVEKQTSAMQDSTRAIRELTKVLTALNTNLVAVAKIVEDNKDGD